MQKIKIAQNAAISIKPIKLHIDHELQKHKKKRTEEKTHICLIGLRQLPTCNQTTISIANKQNSHHQQQQP